MDGVGDTPRPPQRWWRGRGTQGRGSVARTALQTLAIAVAVGVTSGGGCSTAVAKKSPRSTAAGAIERGKATWYGGKLHGGPTASGQRFDKNAMTAAHRTLPFGSIVRVTNLRNHRSVKVRINDRGPFGRGRVIDVSEAAARKLGMIRAGVVPVTVEVIELAPKKPRRKR